MVVATLNSVEHMWGEFSRLCDKYECRKLLIEAPKFDSRLDTMTAFDAGRDLAAMNPGIQIAFYLGDFEPDDVSSFFQTVAQNRSVNVEFFSSINDAREWLAVDDK